MEGIIQYRLLGNHPAASGRYLTLGFPGETTTTDKLLEQVIQDHRINTSRYKLEVCRLVVSREAASSSPPPPPPGVTPGGTSGATEGVSDGTFSGSGAVAGAQNTLVPVVIHGADVLRTYDRLTITVSKRDLADDEAARKEKERLERQQQLKEMEEQLLSTGVPSPSMQHAAGASRVAQNSRGASAPYGSGSGGGARGTGGRSPVPRSSASSAAVDPLRLQRAALLAGQLFPIMKMKHSALKGLDDPANTHQCVLCRLPAFQEELTPCCRFSVCHACYASAAEMVMEEGQCPVCGATPSTAAAAAGGGALTRSPAHIKRARADPGEDDGVPAWKREGDEQKATMQRAMSTAAGAAAAPHSRGAGADEDASGGYELHTGQRGGSGSPVGSGRSPKTGPRGSGGEGGALAGANARDVAQVEERLRNDLDQALSMLDAPAPLTAAAKARRVVSAELAALCE